jgi:hypothetical protein
MWIRVDHHHAAMRSSNAEREPVPVANNAERALPDTWRDGAGRTEG